ncbi:MAG: choice-of-anchor Q domain-containing protein [Bacteroidales bacterium]
MSFRRVTLFCLFLTIIFASFASCGGGSNDDGVDDTVVKPHYVTYFIDSKEGDDKNKGTSASLAWKSTLRLDTLILKPGDTVRFKRGSEFFMPIFINNSGEKDKYITLSDYGDAALPSPSFTNSMFEQDNFGNCIRIKGSYVIVENLCFQHTAAYVDGTYTSDGGWTEWQMGAVYIDKTARNCIVRNNEFFDCVVGIKSYGQNAIIEYNYVHDCNRVLRAWNWGPIGIWLGADFQEVRYNRVFNIRAENAQIPWNGADGGAFEVDDQRNDKTNIAIHHNYTRDCQGFMEITGMDVLKVVPNYSGFRIHHNISDDYQQFLLMWGGANCRIENNTVIRRKVNGNEKGCILVSQANSKNVIANNIFVVENNVQVFLAGQNDNISTQSIIENNLYFNASTLVMPILGKDGAGSSPVYGDPLFVNYANANVPEDYAIKQGSPAINKGEILGYTVDFKGTTIPQGGVADIGAFEFK